MKHLGDISNINGAEIDPVDLITFGSPCQDLSVAGKRAGLKHEANGDEETTRSGLFLEAVRIIKEMREATNGKYPRFALWENVPGAFSSNKGEDFRIVCEEIIKIVEADAVMPEVPKTGWPYADCYSGNGWSLAYRTFDAQYWGVPQRRRRIHLVADFSGECAAKILFEREGVRGYHAQGGKTWQGAATDAESSVGTTDSTEGTRLIASSVLPFDTTQITNPQSGSNPQWGAPCHTLAAQGHPPAVICKATQQAVAYGISSYDSNAMKSANPHSGIYEAGTSRTLDLNGGNPACNQGGIAIVEANSMPVVIDSIGGQGEYAKETEVAPTLKANHYKFPPSVAIAAGFCTEHSANARGIGFQEECAPTLRAGVTPAIACAAYDARGNGNGSTVNTITGDHENRITDYTAVLIEQHDLSTVYATDVGFFFTRKNIAPSLLARGYKDPHLVTYPQEEVRYTVRRLTPTECARLQGFADGWGHIYPKDDLTDDEYAFWLDVRNTHAAINGKTVKEYTKAQMLTWYNKLHSDSAEYKMWGNGIALPPALYCMQGIADVLRREAVH